MRASDPPRAVGLWLLICCAMLWAMVSLGGVTRLLHAGLSIVEWRPVTGLLPPFSEQEWGQAFESYQKYPEYQKLYRGMRLSAFKSIFWLEYLHRLWGRLIALVFLIPLLFFAVTGRVTKPLSLRLVFVFLLGGLQGALGWYMVKSGLVERPDVSQYRLTAHLGLALMLYAYLFWTALELLLKPVSYPDCRTEPPRIIAFLTLALIFLTALSGGFVAGLDAGFAYNTFPLMGGRLIPEGLFMMRPITRNFFENLITVQFDHRVLAMTLLVLIIWLCTQGSRMVLPRRVRFALGCLLAVALLQTALGIGTLLLRVPIPLAVAHQGGALLLLSSGLWVAYEFFKRKAGTPNAQS
ncbi:MAG: COX15/CtaA family protein [Gammaproteobacteria bacterium]